MVLSERDANLHCARVYLRESIARRGCKSGFDHTLLTWCGNARRRAAAATEPPAQRDLFSVPVASASHRNQKHERD